MFLNLEKQRGAHNTLSKFIVNDDKIKHCTHISQHIRQCFETLFLKWDKETPIMLKRLLIISIFPDFMKIKNLWREDLTGKGLYDFLKSMKNGKSAGNNRLTKKFL